MLAGRYQLVERIAAGGFGVVWRASDLLLSRPVAVKLLHAEFARHPETLARFRAEARNAGAVAHQNIAKVYDYGEPPDAPAPFIVMELVEGASLQAALAGGPLEPARVLDIIAQVAAGLDAAHRAGLVHRDTKPSNLLLGQDGLVKITDFGISHAAGAAPVTGTGELMGTPGYLAPERARGGPAQPASDLYSLGVVAWECLAGQRPFTGDALAVTLAHLDQPLPPLPAGVPAELAELVAALTARHLAYRPGSAEDVAQRARRLHGWLAGSGPGAPPAAAPGTGATLELAVPGPAPMAQFPEPLPRSRPGQHRARRVAAVVAAAAALLLIAGVALAAMMSPGPPPRAAGKPAAARVTPAALVVDVSSMTGQPVSVVVRQLKQLGLRVRVRWQASDQEPPGTVVSVLPGGRVPPGSTVTVTGALAPRAARPRPPEQPRRHPARRKGSPSRTAAPPPGTSAPSAPAPAPSGGSSSGAPASPPATPAPPATATPGPPPAGLD